MVCRIFVGVATLFILLVSALGCSFSCSKTTASAGESFFINNAVDDSTIYNLKLIREGGGFPKWSPANNLIVFTEPVNGTYEVFTMTPDGKNVTCLTCGKKDLENCGHRGQPYWHPSGEYIVFTAENKNYERKGFGVTSSPGVGRNHNIWIMSSDGNKFWQITDYPENWGAIKPVFSHDGTKVCWSEEYSMEKYPRGSFWGWLNLLLRPGEELGLWRIKVANISFEDNKPEIQDVKSIELPPELSLLECEGFTPDDNGFICSICDLTEHNGKAFWGDIYIIDFKGNVVKKLTHTLFQHDENAEYSPGGDKIVWSHPPGFYREGYPGKKTELYLMDANGGNKTRLTYFSDPNHPEYDRYGKHCTEITWSPDGKNIVFGHESRLLWRFTSFRDSDLYMLSLQPSTLVENVKLVKENGWRVDWSPNGDLIAFDKTREDGYYDVYVMNPDGTGEKCLTDKPDLPKGHKGCPAWHPSGEYIVFTCQKNQ
ncbi:MAG TPA: hypothetical protein ENI45_04745, partial [Thermoplasmatales archaeon]|nr:hypothetical protein [Thermoplasmatales archaeon]